MTTKIHKQSDIDDIIKEIGEKYYRYRSIRVNTNAELNEQFNSILRSYFWHPIPYTVLAYLDYRVQQLDVKHVRLLAEPHELCKLPKPTYQHDCEHCVYLGHLSGFDLYVCEFCAGRERDKLLKARIGNDVTVSHKSNILKMAKTESGYGRIWNEPEMTSLYVAADCDTKGLKVNVR